MSNTSRLIRQTLVVARRDFVATVFTPTFLIFLFAPLFMLSFGAIGGMSAASVGRGSAEKVRIIALVAPETGRQMAAIDVRLRKLFRDDDEQPPQLVIATPAADPARQAREQFAADDFEASAVIFGPLERPTILYGQAGLRTADYLAELAEQTLRTERGGGAGPLSQPSKERASGRVSTASGRQAAGFAATLAIFFLTLILASQAVGMLAEERGNKVIEVLAAAVPLEAVFLGKLVGLFGVAILFVGFWGTVLGQATTFIPPEIAQGMLALRPAIGMAAFGALFLTYFAMAYLLMGAVFLGVGAQAATVREIQLLSLPITIFQVAMFGLAAAGASDPGSLIATIAELFPFSSPFAMAARAANTPGILPHFAAIAWQLLWVAITVAIGARAFRRGVLQSGSGSKMKLFSRKAHD